MRPGSYRGLPTAPQSISPPRLQRFIETVVSRPIRERVPPRRRGCLWGCLAGLLPLALVLGLVLGILGAAWRSGRLNVLVLGLDSRPGETGPARTDTLILGSFAPAEAGAALLSIPRDLWVDIPGYGSNRINTANYFGDLAQAGYGPHLAMQTVANNFGVPVHGYVRLDFDGFIRLVDTLGGIDLDVPQTIVDSTYPTHDYGITTIVIAAGPQHMDGATALIYARTRHGDSDFERSGRQGQVLRALVARLLQPTAWLRLPAAWAVVRTSFETNLTEVDLGAIFLATFLAGPAGLQTHAVTREMTTPIVTDAGAQVLLPRWEIIHPFVANLFD